MQSRLFATVTALLVGCVPLEAPPTHVDCTHDPGNAIRVIGSAIAFRTVVDGRSVVRVEGYAEHVDDLAIVDIRVAGTPADPGEGSFNWSRWSAELDVQAVALLEPTESGAVELAVTARDVCDRSFFLAVIEIALADPPALDGLALSIDYPGDEDHLPATVSVPAAMRIAAEGRSAGITVDLAAEGVTFLGSEAGEGGHSVALSASGAGGEALVYLTSVTPGETLVVATALGHTTSARLRVAGPPTFLPGTLLAGPIYQLDAVSDGRLVSCQALAPRGVSIVYRGRLLEGMLAIDEDDGHRATFTISVDPEELLERSTVTLTCSDAYGQVAAVGYDTGEPPQPPAEE